MIARFSIHPAIGIARLGNSPTSFCIASEQRGRFPIDCDQNGNPIVNADGVEQPVKSFVDSNGSIRRQAARFAVFVYDDNNPDGREIRIGDTFDIVNQKNGQLQTVQVNDISWTVYLANKKASWYEFKQTDGEHGYGPDHKLRNANITDTEERQRLIIDPGPRSVAFKTKNRAQFDGSRPPAFFPPPLTPNSITSLGEAICTQAGAHNRLLVLGGFGNSGSMLTGFGNPKIETYANNDGWFDDISDGPVSARLICTIRKISGLDPPKDLPKEDLLATFPVDDPAWVVVAYPRYVPEIVDIVTLDDIAFDIAVRQFAAVPYIYGEPPFTSAPAPADLDRWGRKAWWNPAFRPFFYRDIWPILSDPNDYGLVMDKDAFHGSNPHNTCRGGRLDESVISIPPHEGEDPCDRERRRAVREFIAGIVRRSHQENQWLASSQRDKNGKLLYLMPWLCGDNPLSNVAPSKFLRLTDTMLFLLDQWAAGLFVNEKTEDIVAGPMLKGPGRALDRGALSSGLGGSFCPGGEASWIVRNFAIYSAAYRFHHAPSPSPGALSQPSGVPGSEPATVADLKTGLEPGDLTKYSAVPWQSDFNECTNQPIDVSYSGWNSINPDSTGDPAKPDPQLTYWWPAHRPVYVTEYVDQQPSYSGPWSPTATNNAGDLQMVTAWASLKFLKKTTDDQGNLVIGPADTPTPTS